MDLIVGTFNHESLYILHFAPPTLGHSASLKVVRQVPAIGGHSWLALSKDQKYLYATAWTKPKPSVAAYSIKPRTREIHFLNAKHVKSTSGYVCCSQKHLYSVGGPSGEVFRLEADGSISDLVQELDFTTETAENMSEKRGAVPHGDFGGLRHGAHSIDLNPDGRSIYVADIGRNCIWTYSVSKLENLTDPPLKLASKQISPRSFDGPRHTWPHPNGRVLYSLQEHSSMVDIFSVTSDGTKLEHVQGGRIIPANRDHTEFWADEVRLSRGPDAAVPRYLYASTRGLKSETKGYVAVFLLKQDGTLQSEDPIDMWETPTSGGIANAIEPTPWYAGQDETCEYLALTDSEVGLVSVLEFNGRRICELVRTELGRTEDGEITQAATAVWLEPKVNQISIAFGD
jgi:carboxy-cis,cis-muconate cyclase